MSIELTIRRIDSVFQIGRSTDKPNGDEYARQDAEPSQVPLKGPEGGRAGGARGDDVPAGALQLD